jgi:hypothetical protein
LQESTPRKVLWPVRSFSALCGFEVPARLNLSLHDFVTTWMLDHRSRLLAHISL